MGSQQGWLCPASPGLCAARQPMTACASATDAGRRTASQPTNQPTSRTKSKSSFTFRQPCMHHPHCMRAARSERHGWCWLLHCYAQRAETAAAQFVSGQRPSRPPPGTDRWRHSPRPNITSRHSPASRRAVVASAFSYRPGLRRATIRGGPSRSLGRRAAQSHHTPRHWRKPPTSLSPSLGMYDIRPAPPQLTAHHAREVSATALDGAAPCSRCVCRSTV